MSHWKSLPFIERKKNELLGLLPETRASANKYRRGEQDKREKTRNQHCLSSGWVLTLPGTIPKRKREKQIRKNAEKLQREHKTKTRYYKSGAHSWLAKSSQLSSTTTGLTFIWAQQPFFFSTSRLLVRDIGDKGCTTSLSGDASRRGTEMQRARNAAPSIHPSCGFIRTQNSAMNSHHHRCRCVQNSGLVQSAERVAITDTNRRCGAA